MLLFQAFSVVIIYLFKKDRYVIGSLSFICNVSNFISIPVTLIKITSAVVPILVYTSSENSKSL